MTFFDLEAHLAKEHRRTPLSHYLKEIVYGGNDGIVTTFAVVAGFAGAQKDPLTTIPLVSVLLFGLANLFADGLSMSLGSFLSIRTEQDVYKTEKAKEFYEIIHEPRTEFEETVEILKRKKYNETDARAMATLYQKNPEYWTEFMMKDELEMTNPEHDNPLHVAFFTFVSFTLFGAIPLLPYILGVSSFGLSILFTTLALILLGIFRSITTGKSLASSIFETLLVGGTAALAAYGVGMLF